MAGEDPFAMHLLIQSADKLLIDIAKHTPSKQLQMEWTDVVKPEYKDATLRVFRETYNFFKHADRDHDKELHVGDIALSNVLQLAACIANYCALFDEFTDHMRAGFVIARLAYPAGFVEKTNRAAFEEAAGPVREFSPREFLSHLRSTGFVDTMFPKLAAERADDLQDVALFFDEPFAKH